MWLKTWKPVLNLEGETEKSTGICRLLLKWPLLDFMVQGRLSCHFIMVIIQEKTPWLTQQSQTKTWVWEFCPLISRALGPCWIFKQENIYIVHQWTEKAKERKTDLDGKKKTEQQFFFLPVQLSPRWSATIAMRKSVRSHGLWGPSNWRTVTHQYHVYSSPVHKWKRIKEHRYFSFSGHLFIRININQRCV